jgi:hypothetical protein
LRCGWAIDASSDGGMGLVRRDAGGTSG